MQDQQMHIIKDCSFFRIRKKYSISYITCFNEGNAHEIKKILSDLDCKSFPEYLDKIIEAKALKLPVKIF